MNQVGSTVGGLAPSTPEQVARVRRLIARHRLDAADELLLLDVLGIEGGPPARHEGGGHNECHTCGYRYKSRNHQILCKGSGR